MNQDSPVFLALVLIIGLESQRLTILSQAGIEVRATCDGEIVGSPIG
jgi:hypothetical protein